MQNDIKRVLAYSTVSQLGYMFLACGVGAFGAGIFHLLTHAFFKALLFLGSGVVIHAMGGEQDMRHMGGLSSKIKVTYWTMLIATIAIAGPPLAGFFSKDAILVRRLYRGRAAGATAATFFTRIGLLTALLTSFYMFRLVFLTFHGKQRYDEHHVHVHESPWSMLGPLVVLAVLSVLGGWLLLPLSAAAKTTSPYFSRPSLPHTRRPASVKPLHIPLSSPRWRGDCRRHTRPADRLWLYLRQPGKPAQFAKSLQPVYKLCSTSITSTNFTPRR